MAVAKLLTIKDVMETLSLSRSKIYQLIEDRKITPIKLDRGVRFTEENISTFIESIQDNRSVKDVAENSDL